MHVLLLFFFFFLLLLLLAPGLGGGLGLGRRQLAPSIADRVHVRQHQRLSNSAALGGEGGDDEALGVREGEDVSQSSTCLR